MEREVLAALSDAPASGGTLIERLGLDVLVYGALANLFDRGLIEVLAEGPGERVWGVRGAATEMKARAPGLPGSFSLSDGQLGDVDAFVGRATAGLPGFYFEELRRALIARADREGALDLEAWGSADRIRRFLRRVERGGRVALRLRSPVGRLWRVAAVVVLIALLRLFVVGVYTVPPSSISMAPALFPAAEGGDALVLANLLAGTPARGEVWIFRHANRVFVKRVMGLPGERVEITEAGDLRVDGELLVKERALLDRVKVRLPDPGSNEAVPMGYLRPDGGLERDTVFERNGFVRDVVVSGRIVAHALPAGLMITIDDGRGPADILLLGAAGSASNRGVEIAAGQDFLLDKEAPVDFWVTNADGCFRVELNGREVARATIKDPGGQVRVGVRSSGDVALAIELARDLIYGAVPGGFEWTVGRGEIFVLGDNSQNSNDSRQMGVVSMERLLGRVWAVAWPPSRVRLVR